MNAPAKPVYEFGPFRLNPREQRLLRDGEPVALTPKAFELLLCLVERNGQLLSKEELLASVWPDTFVEEAVLSVNMSAVRKALGDDRNGHTLIETVPRRGYRFVAPVVQIQVSPGRKWLVRSGLAGAATLATILLMMLWQGARAPVVGSSVAVLPLQSLSSDPEQKHFADVMTDLLITNLGQIPQLRVVSRQSVLQYGKTNKPMREIAHELKVDCIVEGTVRRDGDMVRITAQLIHGPTDRHLWAQSYERDLRGAFDLQGDVAAAIAQEIGIKLAPKRGDRIGTAVPAAAHEAYLRGKYLLDAGDSEKAITEFRQAVAADANYTAAYVNIADAYFNLGFFGTLPPKEAFPAMKEAALRAIETDELNAGAHAELANVKLHYDWDWVGAEREFRRSLELNPSESDTRHLYAHYLLTMGRWNESMAQMDRAFETDPVGLLTAT